MLIRSAYATLQGGISRRESGAKPDTRGWNVRIRRKNCQAGIVTAFTTMEAFLCICVDAETSVSPVARPLSSIRTLCIMVLERCRPAAGDAEPSDSPTSAVCDNVARLGDARAREVSSFGVAAPEDALLSSSETKRMVGFREVGDSVTTGLSSPSTTGFGESGGSVVEPLSSRLSLRTSTWALKYSSRQSSSLTPLPSGSGGTAKLSRRS